MMYVGVPWVGVGHGCTWHMWESCDGGVKGLQ